MFFQSLKNQSKAIKKLQGQNPDEDVSNTGDSYIINIKHLTSKTIFSI